MNFWALGNKNSIERTLYVTWGDADWSQTRDSTSPFLDANCNSINISLNVSTQNWLESKRTGRCERWPGCYNFISGNQKWWLLDNVVRVSGHVSHLCYIVEKWFEYVTDWIKTMWRLLTFRIFVLFWDQEKIVLLTRIRNDARVQSSFVVLISNPRKV